MLQNHQLVTPEQSSWSCSYFSMFGVRKWTMKFLYIFFFFFFLILHKCDCLVIHWWLHAIELFVMWSVAAWPLLGPVSRYPVTCAGLCGLVEGWVPVDASSGCPIIDWAVETRRWGAGWWPWWCLGGDMPHYIEIAIVLMNWLITLYCLYLLFFFLLTIVASA